MRTLGLLVLASALVSTAAGANNAFEDLSAPSGSALPTGPSGWTAPDAAVLWNNGPLITTVGNCPAGTNESQIRPGGTTFGYAVSSPTFRLADDFTVPVGQSWELQIITVFAYLTGASSGGASPITAVNYQLWNGVPGAAGAQVICGNTTTNQLALSVFSGIYRTTSSAPCPGATTRAIWSNILTLPSACVPCLPAGTYWLDYQVVGGTFNPPVTPRSATANARQSNAGVWAPVTDALGDLQTEDFPFIIEGVQCGATPVESSTWGNIKGQYR